MALVGKSQGMRQLGKPRRRLREILKWVLKNWIRISGLDSFKSFFFKLSPIMLQSVRRYSAIVLTSHYYWHVRNTFSDTSPI